MDAEKVEVTLTDETFQTVMLRTCNDFPSLPHNQALGRMV